MTRGNGTGPIPSPTWDHAQRVLRSRRWPVGAIIGAGVALVLAGIGGTVAYGALRAHVEDAATTEQHDNATQAAVQEDHEIRIRAVEHSEQQQDDDLDSIKVRVIWQSQADTAIARRLGITLPAPPLQ